MINILIPFSEFGNYILFSILAGHVALQFVPEENKPKISIPKPILLLSTLGIIFFTLGPIVQVIFFFKEGVGLQQAILSAFTEFQVGKAWTFIGFMATLLWMTIYVQGSKYLQAFLLFLMFLGVGYASHSASLSFWSGLFSHTTHFLIVSLWTGILIHVSWFARNQSNWLKFLRWFTPFALVCIVIVLISGFIIMFSFVEPNNYMKSWVLPYGQMLLLKHISIIPVVAFAFVNGFLVKKTMKLSSFNPRPWLIGESILLMIVFYFTGVLGTLMPPHEIDLTVSSEGASPWVEWLLNKDVIAPLHIQFIPSFQTILLIIISFVFLTMIIFSFKKTKPYLGLVFAVNFIVALYAGLMLSISV
ncbi:CopD family protein [Peribacillus psychrosaccharolyticus]|uniref:copper resistance D family protein n=1 Tax=Peribacillus psychrosaccharolyticus TaxID=1407 RepID=UPI001F231F2C|nr:CopD family protein [Peribacillus psychrosaccharolyticus]MEC2054749.1 CopD family protein [Peribacillus psychrosaccharolyticus]MED3744024.1 CopD family protein [Peribacillus psychrosaccharolyticus]